MSVDRAELDKNASLFWALKNCESRQVQQVSVLKGIPYCHDRKSLESSLLEMG